MSDLLRRDMDGVAKGAPEAWDRWSPRDDLNVALASASGQVNPAAVGLALGMNLSPRRMPAFIPGRWLAGNFLVPTAGGIPVRSGRLKVMPIFSDTESFGSWLPGDRVTDHPCFGPPPDGLVVADVSELSELREAAGAVTIFLNPAGPGGYQIDAEDGSLDLAMDLDDDRPRSAPDRVDSGSPDPSASADEGPHPARQPVADEPPRAAAALVDPVLRQPTRERIRGAAERAVQLRDLGREAESVALLGAADRLAELMGDYLHRAEMLMLAAEILDSCGRRYAAGRLAHYAALAASLSARGRLEMEAVQLKARLQ